jgi:hypothetical protein
MAVKTDAILKTYFEAGDKPTQGNYHDLIDSKMSGSQASSDEFLTLTGPLQALRIPFTHVGTTFESTYQLAAGSRVYKTSIEFLIPFNNSATIQVSGGGIASILMTTAQNDPTTLNTYEEEYDIAVTSQSSVIVAVGNSPSVGSGVATIFFSVNLTDTTIVVP